MLDMAGLDINASGRKRRRAEGKIKPDEHWGLIWDKMAELGRYGQKTGKGVYRYESGSRTPLPDPEVDALMRSEAARLGIVQRAIDDAEIVDRCILSLINEGARILEEGIALGAVDIDVIYTSGYGFPRWRGGPMFYADMLGTKAVLERIQSFASKLGPAYWAPAPLLVELAGRNGKFTELPRGGRR
jgi:3-hydroxyacyl-CoA dehydrogenase